MPLFARYVGIDYSGAETPSSSLKGLRVYQGNGRGEPVEVAPPPSPRKYWSRREIAQWLVEQLTPGVPTLVGIDHGFSFPLRYFQKHSLPHDWPAFLEDFWRHWPTDGENTYVDFVRDGSVGNGAARCGNNRWRRLTEERAGSAKSVFHFDVQGSVAKSTHAGIPWLRFIRQQLGARVHFWPFDGWSVPAGRSVIAEVYPSLWRKLYDAKGRTGDQHDAYCVAAWLAGADGEGRLQEYFEPHLRPADLERAGVEGWILGVAVQSASEQGLGAQRARPQRPIRRTAGGDDSNLDPRLWDLAAARDELVRHVADVIRGLWAARTAQSLAARLALTPEVRTDVASEEPAISPAEIDAAVVQLEAERQRLKTTIEEIDVRLARVAPKGGTQ